MGIWEYPSRHCSGKAAERERAIRYGCRSPGEPIPRALLKRPENLTDMHKLAELSGTTCKSTKRICSEETGLKRKQVY